MLNITQNMNESNNLFLNFGFSPNFFSEIKEEIYIIERNPMRKISSANAVSALPIEEQISQKKIYEAEDKELYQQEEEDNWSDLNKNDNINSKEKIKNTNSVFSPFSFNSNDNNIEIFSSYSQSQIVNLTKIIQEMNQSNEKRKVIKAYKSKLKSKFYRIYESNSKDYLEKVKYKLFHKCCFPNCGRTFSSSGWLKAHFEEHIKDLKKNSFNILFEKFINDKNFKHSLNQKNFSNLRV
jgi:hypothetical protein